MEHNLVKKLTKKGLFFYFIFQCFLVFSQQNSKNNQKSDFWNHVQFGGGLGLNVGNGFTDIMIAPSAIYNFNHNLALGTGLYGSFVSSKDNYQSAILGGSLISLFNPFEQVQLSAELEEMRVSTVSELVGSSSAKNNFWNTALFLGIGYRSENVTIGVRYNLLFDKEKSVYSDALMPFVRVYF